MKRRFLSLVFIMTLMVTPLMAFVPFAGMGYGPIALAQAKAQCDAAGYVFVYNFAPNGFGAYSCIPPAPPPPTPPWGVDKNHCFDPDSGEYLSVYPNCIGGCPCWTE